MSSPDPAATTGGDPSPSILMETEEEEAGCDSLSDETDGGLALCMAGMGPESMALTTWRTFFRMRLPSRSMLVEEVSNQLW